MAPANRRTAFPAPRLHRSAARASRSRRSDPALVGVARRARRAGEEFAFRAVASLAQPLELRQQIPPSGPPRIRQRFSIPADSRSRPHPLAGSGETTHIARMQFGNSDQDRSNVEDRRGSILSGTGGRLGLGGIVVLGILSLVFKQNLFDVVQGNPGTTTTQAPSEQVAERQAAEKPLERVAVGTRNDAQKFWGTTMQGRHRDAKLVLFWDETRSGCGEASSQTGPFYCPADERVYIDLGLYRELSRRFGAPGDFAQAYVIAHAVAHHLENR